MSPGRCTCNRCCSSSACTCACMRAHVRVVHPRPSSCAFMRVCFSVHVDAIPRGLDGDFSPTKYSSTLARCARIVSRCGHHARQHRPSVANHLPVQRTDAARPRSRLPCPHLTDTAAAHCTGGHLFTLCLALHEVTHPQITTTQTIRGRFLIPRFRPLFINQQH